MSNDNTSQLTLYINGLNSLYRSDYKLNDSIFGYIIKEIILANNNIIELHIERTRDVDVLHLIICAIIAESDRKYGSNIELIEQLLKECDKKYIQIIYMCACCNCQDEISNIIENKFNIKLQRKTILHMTRNFEVIECLMDDLQYYDCNECIKETGDSDGVQQATCFLKHQPWFWIFGCNVKLYRMMIKNNPYYDFSKNRNEYLKKLKKDLNHACKRLKVDIVMYLLKLIKQAECGRIEYIKKQSILEEHNNLIKDVGGIIFEYVDIGLSTQKEYVQYNEIMKYFINDIGMIILGYLWKETITKKDKEKYIKIIQEDRYVGIDHNNPTALNYRINKITELINAC